MLRSDEVAGRVQEFRSLTPTGVKYTYLPRQVGILWLGPLTGRQTNRGYYSHYDARKWYRKLTSIALSIKNPMERKSEYPVCWHEGHFTKKNQLTPGASNLPGLLGRQEMLIPQIPFSGNPPLYSRSDRMCKNPLFMSML